MNSQGPTHEMTDGWYRVFAVVLCFFYLFFLTLVALCDFNLSDLNEVVENFVCVLYALFALASFIFGIMVSLVGMENIRKKVGKSGSFYKIMIWVYILGLVVAIYLKVVNR